MKTLKRILLRPFYALYWVFNFRHPLSFNNWLNKHGFWRLTNWLDNFKVIVPKSYSEFTKKYPKTSFMSTLSDLEPYKHENKIFHHYESKNKEGDSDVVGL